MSRYIFVAFLSIFIFLGCSTHQKIAVQKKPTLSIEEKQDQNLLILEALMNQYYDIDQARALDIYKDIYEKNHEEEYLKEALKIALQEGDKSSRDELLKDGLKRFPSDDELKKMKVNKLIQDKCYEEAKKIMLYFVKHEKTSKNYMVLGYIYYLQKDYVRSYETYKKAYALVLDEKTLLKIVSVLDDKLHKRKKAIEYLESYIRLKKSSKHVYYALLQIYSKSNDLNGLISTYKLLYKNFNEESYAQKIVELYTYKKDRLSLIEFLKQSRYKPALLMDLYVQEQNLQGAYDSAKLLYEDTSDVYYLGRMAIYQYEMQDKHIDKKTLKGICGKFEAAIEKTHLPLYLNYYGYLLIDHDVDVKKGIRYVKMALQKDPKSVYYLDSLAWGYYKLKRCSKAKELMEKIIKKTTEKEILDHYKLIKKCRP